MGTQLPQKGHSSPHFSAHVCCGQTAGWIKMPLGTEVGLSPGNIVLDENPAPPTQKGHSGPTSLCRPHLLWPNGWMDQDDTWYGRRPRPRRHCVRWGPSSPPQKGDTTALPNFRPISIVAKRSLSQQLLSSCMKFWWTNTTMPLPSSIHHLSNN